MEQNMNLENYIVNRILDGRNQMEIMLLQLEYENQELRRKISVYEASLPAESVG